MRTLAHYSVVAARLASAGLFLVTVAGVSSSAFAGPLPATRPTTHPATCPALPPLTTLDGRDNFWRLGQDANGVWWFVNPAGNREFLNTVTTVQPVLASRDVKGPQYVSRDWTGAEHSPGDLDHWAVATIKRVNDIGFKGLGAWCNPVLHKYDIPMTRDLNVWAWMDSAAKRFYEPDWSVIADRAIKAQVDLLKDNHNLVGYYIDNELDWGDGFNGPSAYFDHLNNDNPNRREVLRVIHKTWPTLDALNLDWNLHAKDWSEVDAWVDLPKEPLRAYEHLFNAWLGHLAGDYFRTTTTTIRKYDPNHLILGVRFKGYAPPEVVSASRGLTDALSLNYYVGDAKLDGDLFQALYRDSKQPIVITEYSFHALDGRSGDKDTVGFPAHVPDQQARADGYRLMTSRLAKVPFVVGADWFQWSDEPPGGRADGEDVNFGVVDVNDRPYQPLVDAVRQTAPLLNTTHADSFKADAQKDVWRESYAVKPVMHVPFLSIPPALDGELSRWNPAAKVPGIRQSQTVGVDRNPLPSPNVYLGWTKEGLYMGMEVFDHDVDSAPAKGWWWTRDHVELCFSTRPVASDQMNYTPDCHQFFVVPRPTLAPGDGAAGVVGQWHRDGDAIKDHLIPHPDIKDSVRVLPDRYVVQMFIPAAALHGYDPVKEPAMAFNLDVMNFEQAADYFWSGPREIMAQLHPNTWGTLYLDAPAPAVPTKTTASAAIAPPAQVTAVRQ